MRIQIKIYSDKRDECNIDAELTVFNLDVLLGMIKAYTPQPTTEITSGYIDSRKDKTKNVPYTTTVTKGNIIHYITLDGSPDVGLKIVPTDKTSEPCPGKIIHVFDITEKSRVAVCGYTGFYDKIIPPTSKQINTVNCVNCLNTNYLVKSY